jgi:hypothetical protein
MSLTGNVQILARRPSVFLARRRYILVLSHMRSYSSLLCHILGSHPQIAGYAEMHQSYRNRIDLMRLRVRVFRSLGGVLDGRFVLDKILHNEYSVSDSILNHPAVLAVFLVRRPAPSLTSIVEMGRRLPDVGWYSDRAAVTNYYESRLEELTRLAASVDRSFLFVRAEDIVHETVRAFQSLGSFLGLEQPLEESYSLFEHTGEPGWGDDSTVIREGVIVRERRADVIDFEDVLLSRATLAYHHCCRTLAGGAWSDPETCPSQ